MDETEAAWLAELAITPLIAHAVELLRTLLPGRESVTGLRIEFEDGDGELLASYDGPSVATVHDMEHVTLSAQQEAAARLLLATINYQCILIKDYLHVPIPTPESPEELEELRVKVHARVEAALRGEGEPDAESKAYGRLEEDLRRKLRCRSGEIGSPEPSLTIER